MSHPRPDIIELLAGIEPGSRLSSIRDHRAQARENAQISFEALLAPAARARTSPIRRPRSSSPVCTDSRRRSSSTPTCSAMRMLPWCRWCWRRPSTVRHGGAYGVYREPGLAAESVPGPHWSAEESAPQLGTRLRAALTHAHLLVFRPRESSPQALQDLVDAGWNADDIVALSQLIAFLTFQLRAARGLRVLDRTTSTPLEGANR